MLCASCLADYPDPVEYHHTQNECDMTRGLVPFDGETVCGHCAITVCAYCQGKDMTCEGMHGIGCPHLVCARPRAL